MQETTQTMTTRIVQSSMRRTQLCNQCDRLTIHEQRNGNWYCTVCNCLWC